MMRKSSSLWYHFNQKEANRAECKYCKIILSTAGGSIGNLKRHLAKKHPTVPIDRTSTPRSRSPSTSSTAPSEISVVSVDSLSAATSGSRSHFNEINIIGQANICTPVESLPRQASETLEGFIQIIKPVSISKSKSLDQQLLKMICKEYHPFSLVEDPEFKKFVSLLCPGYYLPSRKTLSQSLLPQVYDGLVESIKEKLNGASAVAITTDGWTSINNQSFLAITAHYLDDNTSLCSNLLGCVEFSERHTSENLASFLKAEVQKWAIDYKVTAVVTDNAPNIVAAVKLCNWRHIPCYAHCINLIVKSGIKPIEPIVEKVKALVQFFKKSSHALSKLHATQKQMGLPELKLKQDVPTRWNSTYDMLSRVFANKAPIVGTLAVLGNDDFKIYNDEWVVIEHSLNILEIFYDITKEISSELTVSLSKTMVLTKNLSAFLVNSINDTSLPDLVKEMCSILHKKTAERLFK